MRLCYHCMQQIQDDKLHTCPNCGKSLKSEQTSPKFLRPGTVLQGKFIVGYPLGAGGFGNTYIGWNQLLLRKVAIKEFYPEQYSRRATDGVTVTVTNGSLQPRFQKGLQQFLEEARNVAALQDIKGVVEISNFFEQNGTGYIVMEYLEGMDVKTILKKSGNKKDYEWSRRVILTVLHTLRDIHKRGVLHRDIAPDNIFVTDEGVIKLIDFGAAKHASALNDVNADIMLKVGYAPIEQYSRTAAQGPYTDIYAVAAMFYRMLTGQKPIPANERLAKDSLIPPSEMGVMLPQQAEMGIMVCLNVKPEYRLQSAEEFMEVLDGKYFIPVYEPDWILPPSGLDNRLFHKIAQLPVFAKALMCFGAICLIGGAVAGGIAIADSGSQNTIGLNSTVENGKIRIEDYTGKSCNEVISGLKIKGLLNTPEVEYELSNEEKGTITKQSLNPSEVVDVDSKLKLIVSGGNAYYTMPDFTKSSEKEILQFFLNQNFDVEVHEDPYDKNVRTDLGENESMEKKKGKIYIKWCFQKGTGKGICYEQSIPAGQKCETAQDLTFCVSMGGEEADFIKKVPDFLNLTVTEAKKRLSQSGLEQYLEIKAKKSYGFSETVLEGKVMKQSIPAGKKINLITDKSRKMILYLSSGPEPTETPAPSQTPAPTYKPKKPNTGKAGKVINSKTKE